MPVKATMGQARLTHDVSHVDSMDPVLSDAGRSNRDNPFVASSLIALRASHARSLPIVDKANI
jgi:hypothetical protein